MTTFEALSLVLQFGFITIVLLTFILSIVVFLHNRSNRPPTKGWQLLLFSNPIGWSTALYAVYSCLTLGNALPKVSFLL